MKSISIIFFAILIITAASASEVLVISSESCKTLPFRVDDNLHDRLAFDADYGVCYVGNPHQAVRNSLSQRDEMKDFTGYKVIRNNIVLIRHMGRAQIQSCSQLEKACE